MDNTEDIESLIITKSQSMVTGTNI